MASVAEGEISRDLLNELVSLLAEDREFTSIEIAETLWLALRIDPVAEVMPDLPIDQSATTDTPSPSLEDGLDSEDLGTELSSPPLPPPPPKVDITTSPPEAGILPSKVLPVWLADPAMLTDPLAIVRALRPLLQQVAAGTGRLLDEAATVDQIARTRLWLPVLIPEREPWFDVVLVVDCGSSMQIWQRLVTDLTAILRRYGAFRNLQVFDLVVDRNALKPEEKVLLKSHPDRPGHRPSELIDQRGQRIAIVLSDCAGQYWWDGTLLPMLKEWSKLMSTVVWQVLPEWMWERTALGRGTAVALSNDVPGAPNQQLIVRTLTRNQSDDMSQRLPLPVVTSDVRDLANWSLMLAGDRREITPGFLLPQQGGLVPKARTIEDIARDRVEQKADLGEGGDLEAAIHVEIEAIARARVDRFRELSSPHARRLVMLLAAAPVITLPVMRLIRDSMLYEAKSPLPIAEVFLSGLLQRLPGQEDVEPDQVQYDFVPKVRQLLLKVLPAVDTIEVINNVSAEVEKRWNQFSRQDFRAFLTNPKIQAPEGLEGLRSFASVTAEILEQLGGEYASFAQQLRQGTGEEPLQDPGLKDVIFPDLEPFEFIDAQLIDEVEPEASFPPLLQTETFTVITVQFQTDEVQANSEADQNLELFRFTVATLQSRSTWQKQGNKIQKLPKWIIQSQPQQAYRFLEALSEPVFLEMVSIPGGTFVMGSPDDEPVRFDNESPQHEVTVAPLFMGRYPVTQQQWRAIVALPQISRELDPEPSRFKGNDRPVERVSWHDAVEFCDRLSAYTKRNYRLPTEAEWEYACRAGTTTPFHFGETITTQLSNYNGISYNGELEGEFQGETNSVSQFGYANTFGLSEMHGNIWEWCQDHWHGNYAGAPTDGSAWLTSNEDARRVLRGGSWFDYPWFCRSACRNVDTPVNRPDYIGFRVVCSAPRILQ